MGNHCFKKSKQNRRVAASRTPAVDDSQILAYKVFPYFHMGFNTRFRSTSWPRHFRDLDETPLGGTRLSVAGTSIETWRQMRMTRCASIDLLTEEYVDNTRNEALDHAALRLRRIIHATKQGTKLPGKVLQANLEYCAKVLETGYFKLLRLEPATIDDDIVSQAYAADHVSVTQEVKSWLELTFSSKKRPGSEVKRQRPALRTVVRMIQASLAFDKIFQKLPNEMIQEHFTIEVIRCLRSIDKITFNIFDLDEKCSGDTLKCVMFKLFTKYDLIRKFKIPVAVLNAYAHKLQQGYSKYNNPYHTFVHAADVAQTIHCFLSETGISDWLTHRNIFAMILAGFAHDVEHTGTTNNFHVETRSHLALLYNDKSILEHHHVSTAFLYMQDENCNVMCNFSKEEYAECRSLIIDMILATDMNHHFDFLKRMDAALEWPQSIEIAQALCLIVHAADISHPAKLWKLHFRWCEKVLNEFFAQGEKERSLGLPISPLCDRHTSKIAKSQIGFIDFVVIPTYTTLFKLFTEVLLMRLESPAPKSEHSNRNVLKYTFADLQSTTTLHAYEGDLAKERLSDFKDSCFKCIAHNKEEWMRKDQIEEKLHLVGIEALKHHVDNDTSNRIIPEESVEDNYVAVNSAGAANNPLGLPSHGNRNRDQGKIHST